MHPTDHTFDRRNFARHQESFHDALYLHLRKTPWWLVSVGAHALVVFVLFQTSFGPSSRPTAALFTSRVEEEVVDLLQPEVKPEIEQRRLIEQDERTPVDPVLDDDPKAEDTETDNDSEFDESMGKMEGLDSSPFEGVANNAEIGIGGSAGGAYPGRGGRKNLRAGGGGTETQKVVDQGLEWLANHQDREGFWDCDGFMKHDRVPPVCDGAGNPLYDPGVSGLALLAFLGAGQTHKHGEYRKNVAQGLRYLKQIQDPEGCFGPRTAQNFTYNHAICALAMAEAYALTASPIFKRNAQQSIDFIHKCQNPYLAWRYGVRPGDNDTSVSGWMVMALKTARVAGLDVDRASFEGLRVWLDKVTEPEYGRVGYTDRGTGPARPQDLIDRFPAGRSESLTAVGILSRIFIGEDPGESKIIQKGVDLCLKALPVWDEESGAIDMYYWYYGSLALFQVGKRPWETWNAAMKEAIIDHQRQDSISFKGSWDPVGPWGREGGRVYSTALMVMCMEVYYRYPQLFKTWR